MKNNKITGWLLVRKEINAMIGIILWKVYYVLNRGREKGKVFLVVPKCSDRELYYLLLYFRQLSGSGRKIVLLAEDKRAYEWLKEIANKEFSRKKISSGKMKMLMLAFPYIWFRNQIIVASLSLPAGRHGEYLLGKDGITFEELFAVGILKINKGFYDKELRPDKIPYEGANQELKDFIARGVKEDEFS